MGLIGLGLLLPLIAAGIGLLLTYWVLYAAIKAGVKDGISEARFKLPAAPAQQPPTAPPGHKWVLVKEEASGARLDELRID